MRDARGQLHEKAGHEKIFCAHPFFNGALVGDEQKIEPRRHTHFARAQTE